MFPPQGPGSKLIFGDIMLAGGGTFQTGLAFKKTSAATNQFLCSLCFDTSTQRYRTKQMTNKPSLKYIRKQKLCVTLKVQCVR